MTDSMNSVEENTSSTNDVSHEASQDSSSTQVTSEASVASKEKTEEKLLRQSEVNAIVGREKQNAYAKAKKEFDAAQGFKHFDTPIQNNATNNENSYVRDDEKIRQIIQQEATKQSQMMEADRVAQEFCGKLSAAQSKYSDFNESVAKLGIAEPHMVHLVPLINSLDNSADVLYDLSKNPNKFSTFLNLSHAAPHLAIDHLNKLSASIKQNQINANEPMANEPLSQITPTNKGGDSGSPTISDLMKKYKG